MSQRKFWISIGMMLLLAFAIIALIIAISTLVRNADVIRTDPINYAINNTPITSCTCYDENGRTLNFGYEEIDLGIRGLDWDKQK